MNFKDWIPTAHSGPQNDIFAYLQVNKDYLFFLPNLYTYLFSIKENDIFSIKTW